jgi:hypothetical protein
MPPGGGRLRIGRPAAGRHLEARNAATDTTMESTDQGGVASGNSGRPKGHGSAVGGPAVIIDFFPPAAAKTSFRKPLVRVLSFERIELFTSEPAEPKRKSNRGAGRLSPTGVAAGVVAVLTIGFRWLHR